MSKLTNQIVVTILLVIYITVGFGLNGRWDGKDFTACQIQRQITETYKYCSELPSMSMAFFYVWPLRAAYRLGYGLEL